MQNIRQVKGILHGESDTRKTTFVEPEETIELNNDIYSLENDEARDLPHHAEPYQTSFRLCTAINHT